MENTHNPMTTVRNHNTLMTRLELNSWAALEQPATIALCLQGAVPFHLIAGHFNNCGTDADDFEGGA